MRVPAMLTAVLLFGAAPAHAQAQAPQAQAPQAAAPDLDARMDAARRLMTATGAIGMAGQLVDILGQQLVTHLAQMNPGRQAEVQGLVAELLLPEFRARVGELEQPMIRIWADTFTVAEMEELIAFYATPTGRKALAAMPQLAAQANQLGMAWGQRVAQEAFAKHEAAMRARGLRI